MTVAELIISKKPKALLNPSLPISVGDIVTTNDDFDIIEDGNVYIVKDIIGKIAILACIERDDSELGYSECEISMQLSELLYLGVGFISEDNPLNILRSELIK